MRYIPFALLITLFIGCSPQLHFLGDNYPPTTHVDTYYSVDDISERFKVIGQLTGNNEQSNGFNSLEQIKNSMVDEAKKRGAHGILFLFADSHGSYHNVKADLIRYLD